MLHFLFLFLKFLLFTHNFSFNFFAFFQICAQSRKKLKSKSLKKDCFLGLFFCFLSLFFVRLCWEMRSKVGDVKIIKMNNNINGVSKGNNDNDNSSDNRNNDNNNNDNNITNIKMTQNTTDLMWNFYFPFLLEVFQTFIFLPILHIIHGVRNNTEANSKSKIDIDNITQNKIKIDKMEIENKNKNKNGNKKTTVNVEMNNHIKNKNSDQQKKNVHFLLPLYLSIITIRVLILFYWNLDFLDSRLFTFISSFSPFVKDVFENLKTVKLYLLLPKIIASIIVINLITIFYYSIKLLSKKTKYEKNNNNSENNKEDIIFIEKNKLFLLLCVSSNVHGLYGLVLGPGSSSVLSLVLTIFICLTFPIILLHRSNDENLNGNKNGIEDNDKKSDRQRIKINANIESQNKPNLNVKLQNELNLTAYIIHMAMIAKFCFFVSGHNFDFGSLQVT
jgi:hypothetical protein